MLVRSEPEESLVRRSALALITVLALAVTPTAVAADDVEGTAVVPRTTDDGSADTRAPAAEPATPVIDVAPDDLAGDVRQQDQRFGFLDADDELLVGARVEVEPGTTALPAPQPGAEVYTRPADGVFKVRGGGFGHGIGMSQYGADGAGKAGLSHAQILAHYYPGTTLETRTTGNIRIGITIDNDGVTRVDHRPGLVVSRTPGAAAYQLPSGFTQWRVRATNATAEGCVLEGRDANAVWRTAWPAGMPQSCPVSFRSPTEGTVDLYLPNGQRRVYRGAITATFRGTTSLATVNHLPMQHYLRSVVMAEMPVSFHAEALKAQAVAARTYALRGSNGTTYYDTCDTTACQAYRGRGVRNADGSITSYEHTNATNAVNATNGQVLTFLFDNGTRGLATTMYSSSNGGHSAQGGAGHHYLKAKPDPYDAVAGNARASWDAQLPASKLEARYGIHRVERIQILRRDGHGQWGGRVLDARVEGYTASGIYTWATATGSGLQLANPWPANANGLSSNYFTIVQGGTRTPSRIAGADRYATAAEVSRAWGAGTSVVYVVNGTDYPDALAAAARAGVYDAPVLLTRKDGLPGPTKSALSRLRPVRAVIVGGTGSVSTAVENAVRGYTSSGDVQRVGGSDRYETAALLASYYATGRPRVYLASGENFPDALSGAALAGHQQVPLLLSRRNSLDPATIAQLQRIRPGEVVVLGGPVAVSDAVARQAASYTTSGTFRRLAGADRWATMRQVAAQFPAGTTPAYVASGQDFPDALVGAALAGGLRGVPIVLTANTRVPGSTGAALNRQSPQSMFVLGGSGVVTNSTLNQLAAYLR